MSVLTAVLFILGVFFLFIGWRWQNEPDKELISALKAFSILKRQVNSLQDNYRNLLERINQNENTMVETKLRTETIKQEINQNLYNQAQFKKIMRDIAEEVYSETNGKTSFRTNYHENLYSNPALGRSAFNDTMVHDNILPGISDKYQKVLELAQFGMSVPEISNRLMLSQDAVGMVLRTYGKGEWM